MKKKWIKILATLFACATLALGFIACKDEDNSSSNSGDLTHEHEYLTEITAPTCTAQGFTTHTCSCSDSYVDTHVNALGHEFTNYVSDNNATYENDGTKTAICNRDGCNETDTVIDTGSKLENGIAFKTFSVNGTQAYGKVSNTTETFSFINEVLMAGTAKYVVSLDIYGMHQVVTKTIPLSVGDNKVYVIEMIDGEASDVFEITIRRRPMYTVTFEGDDGTLVKSQLVEEDSLVNKPEATKAGYILANWDCDFSEPITENTTIIGHWRAVDYPVSYELAGGNIDNKANPTTYTIETDISLVSPTRENYEFLGWYNGENKITTFVGLYGELELTAKWKSIFVVVGDSIMGLTDYGKEHYNTVLDIPSEIDGVTITTIGASAFAHYRMELDKLTRVIIPNSVVSIEPDAFCGCQSLREVVIPYGVESIGSSAFERNCLTSLVIPDSVTSIGNYAFSSCYNLKEVVLPNSIGSIGGDVFYDCPNLRYNEENGLRYLGNQTNKYLYLLKSSSKNITTASVNEKCIVIGSYAFSECFDLVSVEIPDNIKTIGKYAFFRCENLANIMIPDSVKSIGESVFESCDSLKYNIKDNIKYLGNEQNPYVYLVDVIDISITSISIDDNCKCIGEYAFYNCYDLTSIVIPSSVTSIGEYAFEQCYKLKDIHITDIGSWCNIQFESEISNPLVAYGFGVRTKNLYLKNEIITQLVIPDSVKFIGEELFMNCGNLTSVVIPNSVKSIGDGAFYNCGSLKSVVIPDGVTSIGLEVFAYCSSLAEIIIPESVMSIGERVFEGCDSLTIYCKAESQPSGWGSNWNGNNCPVVWGYKKEN